MQKFKLYILLLLAVSTVLGCSEYDDTELRNDVNDLKSRVEKLETWCNTANAQISALQGLVAVVEQNDFVTGVTPITEGSKTIGYTITFSKNAPITIYNGKDGLNGVDGKDGADGVTPMIGAAQDTDGMYYWTIKIGDSKAEWLLADGKKLPVTGGAGVTPQLSVGDEGGILYWKVNGEWLMNNGQKVPVTGDKGDKGDKGDDGVKGDKGDKGDAVFAENGIDNTNPDYVIFTLVDGTKITLPRIGGLTIGFDSYEPFIINAASGEITLVLGASMKATDYTAIKAEISSNGGSSIDIKTRSAATDNVWGVEVIQPTFLEDGTLATSAKVAVTPPSIIKNGEDNALLEVTIIDKNGNKSSSTRILKATPSVGSYYMSDGSTISGSSTLTQEQQAACIGIVYWVGDPTKNDATLRADHPECTHGLVVALGGEEAMKWQEKNVSVQSWLNTNATGFLTIVGKAQAGDVLNNIQGYNNTKAIAAYNAAESNASSMASPEQKVATYRTTVPAPAKSSDWFLPAAKELTLLCGEDIQDIGIKKFGTANRDFINGQLGKINSATPLSLSPYWSFSEGSATRAFYIDFSNSEFGSGSVGTNTKDRTYKVRFCLAF